MEEANREIEAVSQFRWVVGFGFKSIPGVANANQQRIQTWVHGAAYVNVKSDKGVWVKPTVCAVNKNRSV